MSEMSYSKAINNALFQAMEINADVVILGQLIDYKSGVFGTTSGLVEQFGSDRVQDFPVAESLMTYTAVGAAMAGMRPVIVHMRMDFMMYSMDAIVNWMSLMRFKSNGKTDLPVTIQAIVGRGWGQGPQHSKNMQTWFAHLPGIKVAVPATPFDVKGLLLESIFGEDPVIIVEHRSLFSMTADVPDVPYRVRFGHAIVRRKGKDVTLVAIGSMVPLALRVAEQLAKESIEVEVIDPRTISPFDGRTICESVLKTGRLVVADPSWQSFGTAAEIVTQVTEKVGHRLIANPMRISYPDSHTPMSASLEKKYYPDEVSLANTLKKVFNSKRTREFNGSFLL
jgi:pyruvate dehydrogenase E1 component beta subunit